MGRIAMIKEEVRRRGDDHDDEHDETLREDYERNLRGDEFSGHSWELLDQPLKTIGMDQLEVRADLVSLEPRAGARGVSSDARAAAGTCGRDEGVEKLTGEKGLDGGIFHGLQLPWLQGRAAATAK